MTLEEAFDLVREIWDSAITKLREELNVGIFEDLEARVTALEHASTGGTTNPTIVETVPVPDQTSTAAAETTEDATADSPNVSTPDSGESSVVGAVPEPDPEKGETYPTRDNSGSEVDPSAGSPEPPAESAEPLTSGT